MKRSIISAAVLSIVFTSAGAFAANEIGTLIINGTVENSSCYLKNSDAKSTITLPNIDASCLSGLSIGATVGDEKRDDDSIPMVIVCPVGIELNTIRTTGAQLTFGVLNKTSDDASGAGFNLALGDKQITDVEENNLKNEFIAIETDGGIEHTLDFKAKYARLNSDVPVIAGTLPSVLAIPASVDQISMSVSSSAIH